MPSIAVTQDQPVELLAAGSFAANAVVQIQNRSGVSVQLFFRDTAPAADDAPDWELTERSTAQSALEVFDEPKVWARSSSRSPATVSIAAGA